MFWKHTDTGTEHCIIGVSTVWLAHATGSRVARMLWKQASTSIELEWLYINVIQEKERLTALLHKRQRMIGCLQQNAIAERWVFLAEEVDASLINQQQRNKGQRDNYYPQQHPINRATEYNMTETEHQMQHLKFFETRHPWLAARNCVLQQKSCPS